MRVVAVSPHLDDAVFSAGATLAALAADGHEVVVVTCFTRSVPEPTGFALTCQTDKGLAPDVDYMALRRAEDRRACAILGVAAVHLDLPEAPHRGYASAPELFAGVREDDAAIVPALATALAPHLDGLLLAPLGLGGHVDHLQVLAALGDRDPLRWHDQPYALRVADPPPAVAGHRDAAAFEAVKLDACAAHATQLGFQFGGEEGLRAALRGVPERFDRAPEGVAAAG